MILFQTNLSESVVELSGFAQKLSDHAEVILLLSEENYIIGFEAFYVNNYKAKEAFLSLIAAEDQYRGGGYARSLLSKCLDICSAKAMQRLKLEVKNQTIVRLYFTKRMALNFCQKIQINLII